MGMPAFIFAGLRKLTFAAALVVASGIMTTPASAENCADTSWSALAATDCRGAFSGNINGDATELTYLSSQWGGTWAYVGQSDAVGNGPFTSNPEVATNGTLTFDTPISGSFVIGLKASTQYSYYLFNALSPVASLTFDSTAGVAVNTGGNPQELSHAVLYTTAIPEPETYALLLAGLGLMGFIARRRKPRSA